ncbi:hypothetical protein ACLBXM_12940 [Xanthobacteraceae bacterium A53D]
MKRTVLLYVLFITFALWLSATLSVGACFAVRSACPAFAPCVEWVPFLWGGLALVFCVIAVVMLRRKSARQD